MNNCQIGIGVAGQAAAAQKEPQVMSKMSLLLEKVAHLESVAEKVESRVSVVCHPEIHTPCAEGKISPENMVTLASDINSASNRIQGVINRLNSVISRIEI